MTRSLEAWPGQMCAALRPLAVSVLAIAASLDANAVRLDPEGYGQALVYPYYSAQYNGSGRMNTYLSIVNGTSQGKALRVRFRESRAGEEVASFNLYLSPNDVWSASVLPVDQGAALITTDVSCTDPVLDQPVATGGPTPARGLVFGNRHYAGDGMGDGLDRTLEGYVEVLEMGTLMGSSLASATHNSAGVPRNCAELRTDTTPTILPPTGGLSGTLTLIDVARGMDFTLRAEALADLATRPYFRFPDDPYPGYEAAEIDPVSVVQNGSRVFRSQWSTGAQAVSAVLMRTQAAMEFTLDARTRSLSDLVVTFPTRHLGPTAGGSFSPFRTAPGWGPSCAGGESVHATPFNRESRGFPGSDVDFTLPPGPLTMLCGAANVIPVSTSSTEPPSLLLTRSYGFVTGNAAQRFLRAPPTNDGGWVSLTSFGNYPYTESLATSTMWDTSTGQVRTGPHTFQGLPKIAFSVRSFENGTLQCAAGACQGNYGGAFAASYGLLVSPRFGP